MDVQDCSQKLRVIPRVWTRASWARSRTSSMGSRACPSVGPRSSLIQCASMSRGSSFSRSRGSQSNISHLACRRGRWRRRSRLSRKARGAANHLEAVSGRVGLDGLQRAPITCIGVESAASQGEIKSVRRPHTSQRIVRRAAFGGHERRRSRSAPPAHATAPFPRSTTTCVIGLRVRCRVHLRQNASFTRKSIAWLAVAKRPELFFFDVHT